MPEPFEALYLISCTNKSDQPVRHPQGVHDLEENQPSPLPGLLLFLILQFTLTSTAVWAFQSGPGAAGCSAGDCRDCHNLEPKEVVSLFHDLHLDIKESDVLNINLSDVPGLWETTLVKDGKTFTVMVDFSKEYVIQGRVFHIVPAAGAKKAPQSKPKVIDVSKIPLDDALLIGKADAPRKIIVFDDPECPFCARLQPEMQAVVKKHPEVAFLIKLFPLVKIHPNAYENARSIVCAKSLSMLEDSLSGKPVPPPVCDTDQVKNNLELGRSLGMISTPTLIMPDGRVLPGIQTADNIFRLLNGEKPVIKEDGKPPAKERK